MTQHQPTGWNTWDYEGFNRLVYLRRGKRVVAVQFAIWDESVPPPAPDSKQVGVLHERFRWSDVTRLGPHAPLGLPASLEFRANAVRWKADAVERAGRLALTVTPQEPTQQRVVFQLVAPVGEAVDARSKTSGTFARSEIDLRGATWPRDYFVNVAAPYAIGGAGSAATIRILPPGTASPRPRSRQAPEPALVGSGALADAPEAMMQAVTWNTLYDARRQLVSSPVSRDWCYDWRGVIVFCWDTYLVATFASYAAPHLARLNFEAVTAAIDELGFVPNYYMAHGAASRDRSMPPLGAYLVWKHQRAWPDRAWLRTMYPQLRRWHTFWTKHRDGNGNGLLSWGSNPVPYEFPELVPYNGQLQHSQRAAVYESGLDNSPMYDDVPFDEQAHTLAIDDITLSSYYAMDCEALASIADCLGEEQAAANYRKQHAAIARRINEDLWDEEHGIYCNRHWSQGRKQGRAASGGQLSSRWAPTSFFPLIAGVATPERAERMVGAHLLNEDEFWGEWVLPSISRSDPAYPDNDYWRGRIWGPFNFLVAEGLRRYRFDAAAAALAEKSLALFMKNWRADGGVYENYNADTGEGADVWNAARLYHWGGLLAFIAMQELIDVEPLGYLRVGSLAFPEAALRGVHIGGDAYDVEMNSGVYVQRNGRKWLACTTRAIVRLPLDKGDEPIELAPADSGQLTLYQPERRRRVLRLPDGSAVEPAQRGRQRVYRW